MTEAATAEHEVDLRDGSRVPIRPIRLQDKDLVRAAFDRLSPESRYRRFLTPMPRLTEVQLAYLTEVDHRDHEALVALDSATGDGVGVARFVRDREDAATAEAAVTGLGEQLPGLLRAAASGFARLVAGRTAPSSEEEQDASGSRERH